MSEDISATNDGNHGDKSSRPQTVSLTMLHNENNNSEDETSIGDVFFSKVNGAPGESNENTSHNVWIFYSTACLHILHCFPIF